MGGGVRPGGQAGGGAGGSGQEGQVTGMRGQRWVPAHDRDLETRCLVETGSRRPRGSRCSASGAAASPARCPDLSK